MKTALLIDGMACFQSTRIYGDKARMDLSELEKVLCEKANIERFDFVRYYDAYNPQKPGHVEFLNFIKDKMKWQLDVAPFSEANVLPPNFTAYEGNERKPYIRFSTKISFALARLAGVYDLSVVVSDSYTLREPMLFSIEKGTATALAFISSALDSRWLSKKSGENKIKFLDLEDFSDRLIRNKVEPFKLETSSRLP